MRQPLLNALSIIENIYDDAMYNNGDMFRIKDIIHSVSSNQISSKEWLAYEFKKQYYYSAGKILIIGGWYGLLAYCLRQKFPGEEMNIVSIDKDPKCEDIAWRLFPDINAEFLTADVFDFDLSNCRLTKEEGCTVTSSKENKIEFEPYQNDFEIVIEGLYPKWAYIQKTIFMNERSN